jgi:hypothetical protein
MWSLIGDRRLVVPRTLLTRVLAAINTLRSGDQLQVEHSSRSLRHRLERRERRVRRRIRKLGDLLLRDTDALGELDLSESEVFAQPADLQFSFGAPWRCP